MRDIFADGWNSVAHVSIGIAAATYPELTWAYVTYQVAQGGPNTTIDLLEFLGGLLLGSAK